MKFIDMHCDTISSIYLDRMGGEVKKLRENNGHVDLARLKKGGCLAQNFALFTILKKDPDPYGFARGACRLFKEELAENDDMIRQAVTVEEILRNDRDGRMSGVLTIEEGGICNGSTDVLRDFYREGVRMMTLTWNYENDLAYPNKVDMNTGISMPESEHGLKKKGIEFVELMEEIGMAVDVSHLGDAGFWDVAEIMKKPFAASHSNARAIAGHTRNLTDEMIRTMAERGGVMGINYCPVFLDDREDGGTSCISAMVRHIKHIRNVGGIECIGLGSDFDGISGTLEIDSPSAVHLLEEALYRNGFTQTEVEKIFYRNVLRFYGDVWKK
ncbi:dipeptidase [[Clostridium] symbiosum]|uniref:Renal dipeptidase family protein n=1 Tax=[Clostridium] symbiosum ATCC 14940 TaxID=411472 RepID=A0ABC9U044_CLOSY|nr:dipeptidase [[Clostridium] symbiosum]ERI78370.1 renal dipeptidase family protein [[Clostridium] symbiosum ATCC 14940]MDB2036718.1 dipeptidase [[Clostridium] symbiosum]MDM8135599.1 dipeptidase [[Clostridium] symbiosum]MDM8140443.1 dipeptidase [[Clostridium] symbiosum]MDM8320036.1 dipeptidase [[Clostridium] symbiosum]